MIGLAPPFGGAESASTARQGLLRVGVRSVAGLLRAGLMYVASADSNIFVWICCSFVSESCFGRRRHPRVRRGARNPPVASLKPRAPHTGTRCQQGSYQRNRTVIVPSSWGPGGSPRSRRTPRQLATGDMAIRAHVHTRLAAKRHWCARRGRRQAMPATAVRVGGTGASNVSRRMVFM